MAQLNAELTINLGMAIDKATHKNYSSALNSYLTFCQLHKLDIEPTQQTLALFITFQSTHINSKSVDTYLSSITNQLETHFPDIRAARKSPLISVASAQLYFGFFIIENAVIDVTVWKMVSNIAPLHTFQI
jgi:hypothetical protein